MRISVPYPDRFRSAREDLAVSAVAAQTGNGGPIRRSSAAVNIEDPAGYRLLNYRITRLTAAPPRNTAPRASVDPLLSQSSNYRATLVRSEAVRCFAAATPTFVVQPLQIIIPAVVARAVVAATVAVCAIVAAIAAACLPCRCCLRRQIASAAAKQQDTDRAGSLVGRRSIFVDSASI
jgi:hypothetical protein